MQILKKITMLAFLMSAFAVGAMAQLTGTKNVPGDYATVAAAVTDLNTQGVGAGGVTFVVADGYTETAPAGGYTISNPTGNGAGNPIVFRRTTSTGTRPVFTASAALTAGSLTDAIFKIVGTDNLTIDGFSMTENAANTTTAAGTNNMTEFGVALFYATTTNGSQNVTVQNCIIDLDRTYQNTFGIYSNSTHSATAVTTSATATTTDGGNSGLKLYSNSITDVNIGIVVVGPTAAADNNDGLDIGGTAVATGNSITNYGTTGTFSGYANVSGTVNGILVRNTRNFNVSFNSIASSNGGVTAGTLRGIYVPSFTNAPTGTITNSINNNNISLRSGLLTGAMLGIVNEATTVSATTTLSINNNDFSNTTHTTATASGAITFISQAATTLNTNINSNTFTNMSVNTTGNVTFITNSVTHPAGAVTNVSNNSVVTAFSKTGAGGTVFFYDSFGSTTSGTETNTGNNFSNMTFTGATTISGFRSADGASPFPSKTVTNNTFNNITNGAGAITILTVGFSPATTASNVSGNIISNVSGGSSILGLTSSAGTQNFFSNTINTLASTGASAVTGISITGGVTQSIYRNRIYDLSGNNAGTFVSGILVSSIPTTATSIYNNLIGDLRATAATSTATPVATDAIRGINITGTTATTALNVSFNTVYLNAVSSGANFSSSALFATVSTTATSATLNSRNNIFVNLSTPTGTGIAAAYRRSGTALDNYGSVSNNNDYFAGTPSATNLIFYDGTNSDQTLGAFKTRVTPRDSASVSENPNFLSTTGSNANFLHINTATPTQLESGGVPIAGITDDFDGQTRNATTPDIGADEFTGTAIDLNPPSISYTPLGNTTTTTNRTITATITDGSGVAGGANSPRIYFRKNGGAYFSTQCVLTTGSSYTCTIDYTLLGGVVTGDVVNYFVVAQDINGNVGANPSNGFSATNVNNVTSPPTTPNGYTIVAGFATSVNVGTGETYTSLTNAGGIFEALNAAVLTGNVTVNLTADLAGETGAVALNQLTEEGTGGYTVTIKPTGAARTITGTAANLIKLNGADRVTIDGSLNGGTDRSLTINNTSTSTSGYGVWIASVNATNGALNNTVKNCIVNGNAPTTTLAGLVSSGSALGGVAEAANTGTTFQNNALTASQYGIAMVGPTGNETGNSITGNTVGSTVAASKIGFNGIAVFQESGTPITRNSIAGVVTATSSTTSGIRVTGSSTGVIVNRNTITDVKNTSTSGFGANGISLISSSTTANVTVSNNFITDVAGFGFNGVDIADNGYGIVVAGGGGYNIYDNSVNLVTNQTATGGITSAVNILAAVTTAGSIDLRDNILANGETIGTRYAVINASTQGAAVFTDINYNDYFAQNVGRQGTTVYPLLTDWQGATGKDANSKAVDPLFVSATDLHLQSGSTLRAMGTPIAGITTDIDGDNRNPSTPDIGADEFASFVFPTVQYSSANYTGAEGTSATITVTRTGDTTIASSVNYATSDGTATGGATCGTTGVDYQSASGTLNFAAGDMNKTFSVVLCSDSNIKGNETVNLTLTTPTGATLGTPSTATLTITNVNPPVPGTLALSSATYSVGEAGGTATITVNRTTGTDGAVSATYALTDGTATGGATCAAGVDFINTGGTVSFASGEAVKTFTVAICNDTLLEGNETFNVTLSNATGGATIGTPATAVVTILDDEVAQPGILQFNPATYSVGEAGPTVTLTVTRTGGTDGAVGASYSLANGTATGGATCAAGVDFVNTGGTVSFTSGQSSQTFTVAICNDTLLEGNETFTATLATPTGGATIGAAATATVTIVDDEVAQPGTLALSAATYTVAENVSGGNLTVTVNRTGGTDGAVGATYALTNGTATGGATCAAGVDFINTGGTVSFASGVSTQTFTVAICNDTVFEGNETFNVTLSNATGGATIGTPAAAVVTITDDEVAQNGSVQFSAATYTVTEAGPTATITVTRTGGSDGSVSASYATVAGGTATGAAACAAGVDYVNTSGTVTFGAGVTTPQTFTIPICNDTVPESSETVNLALTNPTGGATLGTPNTAVLTITDDDTATGLSGSINVGAGQTYTSLTNTGGVFDAINTQGATGDITINITSDLTAETGTVALENPASGVSQFATTIKPSGAARTISGSSTSGIIRLNGADNVTIDGSLTGGTATGIGGDPALRNLTVQNTSTTATAGAVIAVFQGLTGAMNVTIKNVNVSGQDPTQTLVGIHVGGNTVGSSPTFNNNNSRIENCSIQKAILGIFDNGTTAVPQTGTVITRNDLSATGASRLRRAGIFFFNQNGITVTENSIGGIVDDESADAIGIIAGIQNITTTATTTGGVTNANISRNRINGIASTSTTGFSAAGIAVAGGTTGANTIANNMITGVNAPSTSPDLVAGIFVAGVTSSDTRLYYNSVAMTGDRGTVASQIGSYGVAITGASPIVELKDNIFYTTQTSGGGTAAKSYAIGLVSTTFTNFNSNYNDFYSSGANAGFFRTGGISTTGTDYANLAAFRAATGSDANSKEVDPLFVDPLTNLHLTATSPVLDMGTPVTGVTVDFDGDTRSTTTPDIGADEVAGAAQQNGTLALSAATYTVSEAASSVTITVNRTGGTDGAVGATYALTNGTATGGATCAAGVDFINTGGTVSFASGVSTQTFTVAICNDTVFEGNETFNVTLSNATGGATIGTPAAAVVTITDDEVAPTISINSVSQNEGNSGTTPFAFTVTLSAASGQTVTVNYFTADGTATAPSDYTAIPNTLLTFAPGETTKTVTVLVNGDTTVEPDETFNVNLATPTNATIATAQGIGTIVNDDSAANLGSFSINDVDIREGNSGTVFAVFTVTLTNPNGQASSVSYASANGTATAGVDYTAVSGVLNFAPGEITKTISVPIIGDTIREPFETFFINLSNPVGATIADGQGLGTIIDDDRAVVADFDRDGKTDFSVFRPSNGYWYVLQSGNNVPRATLFGLSGDLPVPGDYDGDRITDVAVFRPSNGFWYIMRSSDNVFVQTQFGFGTDKPVQGDFDGDGKTDIAVWRPSNGTWYVLQSSNGQFKGVAFGANGDVPVQGDYDGDTKTDMAVYRSGVWYVLNSANSAVTAVQFGASTDKALVGDFDGDGKSDYTVYRAGVWYIFQSQTNTSRAVIFGAATDIPTVGDYDGDGNSDVAVFRPSNGTWYVLQSTNGFTAAPFGQAGDIPIPAGYQSLQ